MDHAPEAKTTEFVRRYWSDDDAQPKHERLSQAFVAAIGDGFWQAGARLPAEQELVQATPCSLGTVQKALKTLADADLIRRRRGSGTVVTEVDRPLDAPWHMRFHAPNDPGRVPVPVYARILDRALTAKPGPWTAPLGQEKGAEIVRLTRIMSIGGQFDVFNVFCARPDRFPELVETPVAALNARNLKELMAQNHRLIVHRVEQEMTLRVADARAAKAAGWPAGTTVTVLSAVGYDLAGTAMYYQEYHIPPNALTLALGSMTRP